MEIEKLFDLPIEKKKKILFDLIKNDVSYWKKISILMAMENDEEDNELLNLIIDHKIEEINLANKKYNFDLKIKNTNNIIHSKEYMEIMKNILNDTCDSIYSQACTETLEVLKHIPNQYYKLINNKFIERLENNADINYIFEIKDNDKFSDLKILRETKDILSLISDKFWKIEGYTININEIFNKKEN